MADGSWVFDLALAAFLLWQGLIGIRNRKLELHLRGLISPIVTLHSDYALASGLACLVSAVLAFAAFTIDGFMQNNIEVIWISQIALIAAVGLSTAVFVFCLIIQSAVAYGHRLSHPKDTSD